MNVCTDPRCQTTAGCMCGANAGPDVLRAASETHDWFRPDFIDYDCCRKCGIVRRRDGKNRPCRGIARIGLRDEYTEGA